MTQINLNSAQISRLAPIKERGGYSSITAVVGALIAIYGDDLLLRVSLPPVDALLPPNTSPSIANTRLDQSPTTPPPPLNTAPTSNLSPPKRVKFEV
jgi:hypothetical protein